MDGVLTFHKHTCDLTAHNFEKHCPQVQRAQTKSCCSGRQVREIFTAHPYFENKRVVYANTTLFFFFKLQTTHNSLSLNRKILKAK